MGHTVVSPTLAMVEDNYRKAQHAAAQFFQTWVKCSTLVRAKNEFETRNQEAFKVDDSVRAFQKIILPFYFAAGLVQCIFLVVMLDATFFKEMKDAQFWYSLICIFSGIAPIGCSLFAGHCFHKIHFQGDMVVANRVHLNRGWLAAFVLTCIVYLTFVVLITAFSSNAGEYDLIIVPILAIIELVLGIPALASLSMLIVSFIKGRHLKRLEKKTNDLLNWSEKCATYYRYYHLYHRLFNNAHPELQLELQFSPQIERAIQYYEGNWNNDSLSQLQ